MNKDRRTKRCVDIKKTKEHKNITLCELKKDRRAKYSVFLFFCLSLHKLVSANNYLGRSDIEITPPFLAPM